MRTRALCVIDLLPHLTRAHAWDTHKVKCSHTLPRDTPLHCLGEKYHTKSQSES